jgi:hypothetical protein
MAFTIFRRSVKPSVGGGGAAHTLKQTPPPKCTCAMMMENKMDTHDWPPLGSVLAVSCSRESHSTGSETIIVDRSPPTPKGGGGTPILLPNEMLLQQFPNKKSAFRPSRWKLQQQKLKCEKCRQMCNNAPPAEQLIMALESAENNHYEMLHNTCHGTIYITSERLIFVPRNDNVDGYSLDIASLTGMKAIESTQDTWFFVCYKDMNFASIPFSNKNRAQSFLRLMKNIRFEHMVCQCLPPRYTSPLGDDDVDEWWYGDNQLPSYEQSEQALHKYLVSLGLLKDGEPLDRSERISNLIEIASAPRQGTEEEQDQTITPNTNMPAVPPEPVSVTVYHSPYVWF